MYQIEAEWQRKLEAHTQRDNGLDVGLRFIGAVPIFADRVLVDEAQASQSLVGQMELVHVVGQGRSKLTGQLIHDGSGLVYVKPRMLPNRFGRESLTYEGVGENKKWSRIETYGPKLTENVVQGTARDLLALAMLRLRNAGFEIVMHIHDEAVVEVPEGISSVDEICRIMSEAPAWAADLPLRADGYECEFYKKD